MEKPPFIGYGCAPILSAVLFQACGAWQACQNGWNMFGRTCVRLLVEAGARSDIQDVNGRTAVTLSNEEVIA